ncbi:hypothetical protein ACA910_015887 [Epithemia clementina (nom. ined.)]
MLLPILLASKTAQGQARLSSSTAYSQLFGHQQPAKGEESFTTTTTKKSGYLLAHMNYARLVAPLDDPCMSEFNLALDPVNALSRATPGYVWSLDHTTEQDRMDVPLLRSDPLLMPQLSLWESHQGLSHFAFKSGHAIYLKRKKEWFTSPPAPWSVCWWFLPSNQQPHPTLALAFGKLDQLRANGPAETAFDLKNAGKFPRPD